MSTLGRFDSCDPPQLRPLPESFLTFSYRFAGGFAIDLTCFWVGVVSCNGLAEKITMYCN